MEHLQFGLMQSERKILYNEDIFGIAIDIGYTIDNVYKLITENPSITSINYDLNANPGLVLEYDPNFKVKKPQSVFQYASRVNLTNGVIKAQNDQSLFDIALMSTGIENVINLVNDNNLSNIDNTVLEGKIITFALKDVKDVGLYNRGLVMTTGESKDTSIYYLLLEDGFFLLQENGDRIILE